MFFQLISPLTPKLSANINSIALASTDPSVGTVVTPSGWGRYSGSPGGHLWRIETSGCSCPVQLWLCCCLWRHHLWWHHLHWLRWRPRCLQCKYWQVIPSLHSLWITVTWSLTWHRILNLPFPIGWFRWPNELEWCDSWCHLFCFFYWMRIWSSSWIHQGHLLLGLDPEQLWCYSLSIQNWEIKASQCFLFSLTVQYLCKMICDMSDLSEKWTCSA